MNPFRREADIDIIIRGSGKTDLTRACIQSIEANTDMERVNLIYVDNGSEWDEWGDLIAGIEHRYTLVRLPFNHGACRATNAGLSLAFLTAAPYILIFDNDIEIPSGDNGWLDRWLTYFEDETVAAAGAVSDYASGLQTPHSAPHVYSKAWQEGETRGLAAPPDVPILASFGMLLRKSAIEDVGLIDERYEPGNFEDWDYVLSLREAGYKAVVAASIWLHHKGSQTFSDSLQDLLATNQQKLIDKWGVDELQRLGLELSDA